MRKTYASALVAQAILARPDDRHWGYELSKETGLRSGVLYPLLHRMLSVGWLTDGWEEHRAGTKRPPRRYYELTDLGRMKLGGLVVATGQHAGSVARLRGAW